MLGGAGKWEFEVGEPLRGSASAGGNSAGGLTVASTNPLFLRQDTRSAFQFRIRNLPYPLDTYTLTIEEEARNIVLRTTNKKYFKRFSIPDLDRMALPLEFEALSMAHANNTLIITYKKPKQVAVVEEVLRRKRAGMKLAEEGDVDMSGCAQQ